MSEAQGQALATSYLSPSTDSLWRWSADGEVLTWSDGTTIAFRQEVEAVVERLAPHGLPPFGAVALLLGACRDGWEQASGREGFLRYANCCLRGIKFCHCGLLSDRFTGILCRSGLQR